MGKMDTKSYEAPDFDKIDNVPTTRRERQKAIWTIIERGEELHEGYNLQSLIAKLSVSWAMKHQTLSDYFEGMQRAGFIYIDRALKVRICKK